MKQALFIIVCVAAMAGLFWFLHHMVYSYGRDFGIGFSLGGIVVALISGAYITLRYGD